jgi:Na+/phosphate symporter
MIIYLSLLICIIGLLVYALSKDGRVQEIGRLMFFAGLLAFLLTGGAVLDVIRR